MPIYDYKCSRCEAVFEKIVKDSTTKVICRDCGSTEVAKNISAPRESGVVLKGEGFYKPSQSSW